MHIWEFNSGSFPASLCVSSPAFVLDASKKNQFLPLGKLEEALWHCCLAFMAGQRQCTLCTFLYIGHCALCTSSRGRAAAAKDTRWRESVKVPAFNQSQLFGEEGDSSILEKTANQPKEKKLKAKEIKSRGVQSEQEGVPTSKQTCWLPGCICYISATPPSDSSSGFLADQLKFEADCILSTASPSSLLILIHQVSKA